MLVNHSHPVVYPQNFPAHSATGITNGEIRLYMPASAKESAKKAKRWREGKGKDSWVAKNYSYMWEINKKIASGMPLSVDEAETVARLWHTKDVRDAAAKSDNPWSYPSYCRWQALGCYSGVSSARQFLASLGDELASSMMRGSDLRLDAANGPSKRCGDHSIAAHLTCHKPVSTKTLKRTTKGGKVIKKRTAAMSSAEEVIRQRNKTAKRLAQQKQLKTVMNAVLSGKIETATAAISVLNKGGSSANRVKGQLIKALKLKKGESLKEVLLRMARANARG